MMKRLCKLVLIAALCLACTVCALAGPTGLVKGTNVNVRASHSTKGRVLGRLSKPAEVEVLDSWGSGSDEWFKVRAKSGLTGWMSAQFIEPAEIDTPENEPKTELLVTGTNVNIRADHSTKARALGRVSKPAVVEMLDAWDNGKEMWTKIKTEKGVVGWMSSQFLVPAEGGEEEDKTSQKDEFETFTGVVTGTNVNIRADHTSKSKALGRLSKPARVTVIDNWATGAESWWKVRTANGLVGWMNGDFVMNEAYLPPEQKQTPPPQPKAPEKRAPAPAARRAPAVRLDGVFQEACEMWLAGNDAASGPVFEKLITERTVNPAVYLLRSVQLTSGKDTDHDAVRARSLELKALDMKGDANGFWNAVMVVAREPAQEKQPRAMYLCGRILWLDFSDENAVKEGMTWMQDAANAGYSEAQYQLGQAYAGWPPSAVKEDLNEAIVWYRKAAEQDHVPAMEELARCLEGDLGEGQERQGVTADDLKEAFKWYTAAADQGSYTGQYGAAMMLRDGRGAEKDLNSAAELFEAAAYQGHGEAAYETAVRYARGEGVEQSWEQAYKWMRVAEDVLGEYFFDRDEVFLTAGDGQTLKRAAAKRLDADVIAAMDKEAEELLADVRRRDDE
jgi:TPR repeat protein/uncharacterized protein YgiM (DUF1202 family)